MIRPFAPIAFVAMTLGACDEVEKTEERAFAEPEQPLTGIYIARYEAPPQIPGTPPRHSRLALFHGSYKVMNACLIFDMGDKLVLPRFSDDTKITVFLDRVIIGNTTHQFSEETTRGGGSDGKNEYSLLVEPPPERCRYSVIGP